MRWVFGEHGLEAATPVGAWAIDGDVVPGEFYLFWTPPSTDCVVVIGHYKTIGAAKGAAKRYARKLAAAFKAMGKAGWQ